MADREAPGRSGSSLGSLGLKVHVGPRSLGTVRSDRPSTVETPKRCAPDQSFSAPRRRVAESWSEAARSRRHIRSQSTLFDRLPQGSPLDRAPIATHLLDRVPYAPYVGRETGLWDLDNAFTLIGLAIAASVAVVLVQMPGSFRRSTIANRSSRGTTSAYLTPMSNSSTSCEMRARSATHSNGTTIR